jgi:general secretion pathway protein H
VDLKRHAGAVRGFTLIELMIVVALVAVAAGVISLSLRDPANTRLEHEAARLAVLLESARAESRASGLPVRWVPQRVGDDADFRFVGLPDDFSFFGITESGPASRRWLDRQTTAEVVGGAGAVVLGPEPLIGAQRIVLHLGDRHLELRTDGLGPFAVGGDEARP